MLSCEDHCFWLPHKCTSVSAKFCAAAALRQATFISFSKRTLRRCHCFVKERSSMHGLELLVMHCISRWRGNFPSCCSICRRADVAESPRHLLPVTEPTSPPASRLCPTAGSPEKTGRRKSRSIFSAEPLQHAFRSVFCLNKQATTLTGLFFNPAQGERNRHQPLPTCKQCG